MCNTQTRVIAVAVVPRSHTRALLRSSIPPAFAKSLRKATGLRPPCSGCLREETSRTSGRACTSRSSSGLGERPPPQGGKRSGPDGPTRRRAPALHRALLFLVAFPTRPGCRPPRHPSARSSTSRAAPQRVPRSGSCLPIATPTSSSAQSRAYARKGGLRSACRLLICVRDVMRDASWQWVTIPYQRFPSHPSTSPLARLSGGEETRRPGVRVHQEVAHPAPARSAPAGAVQEAGGGVGAGAMVLRRLRRSSASRGEVLATSGAAAPGALSGAVVVVAGLEAGAKKAGFGSRQSTPPPHGPVSLAN